MLHVLFFGAAADIVGARTLELEASNFANAAAVLADVKRRFPALASHRLFLAVNQQHANGAEAVTGDDEIAIFTAVSGG